jgi:CRISPR-associated endoribonuclease Cas6
MITLRFHLTSPFSGEIGFSGIALRAGFLNYLREYDNELSGKVHGANGLRAYSIDPFPCNKRFITQFEEGQEYDFSVHLFRPSAFQDLIRKIVLNNCYRIRLYHHTFSMIRIDFERKVPSTMMKEWTRCVDESDRTPIRMRFRFETPTQLSNYGSDRAFLLPTPEKVFTGLLRIWNTMENATHLETTSEYHDWTTKNIYISGHNIQTVKVPLGRQRNILGFIGNIVYNIDVREDPLTKLTVGLAKFAEISNVGKNRSAGFGKVYVDILEDSCRNG